MDFQTAQQRAQQLREQIEYYSKLYYEQDDPAISDYDFDKLMHELIDIEEAYPELLTPDSPTHRVGGKASNSFAPVEHVVQMGSLQDVFSSEEVEDFDRRVRETVPNPLYVVEPKIDGLSVSLEYRDGLLVRGSTRGDGFVGEDVTTMFIITTGNWFIHQMSFFSSLILCLHPDTHSFFPEICVPESCSRQRRACSSFIRFMISIWSRPLPLVLP